MKFRQSVLTLVAASCAFASLSAVAADKTKVEFWSNSLSPKFDAVMKDLTARFNAANPDIQAVWVDVDWDAFQPRFISAVAAGNAPDLVNLPVPWAAEYAQKGLLLPLDSKINGFKGMYTDAALKDVTYNGKVYGLPWYNSVSIIAYNKGIFDKAGLKTAPKSLDELFAYSRQIKDKTGVAGFAPKVQEFSSWFMYQGLPVIQNGKAVFNSPEHVKFVERFAQAWKDGSIPKDVFKMEFEQEIAAYDSGKIAMMTTSPQALKRTQTDAKPVYAQTVTASFPLSKGNTPFGGYLFFWSVPQGSKHADAAIKLGQFLTNDANQLAFSKATETTFPSTRNAVSDAYFQSGANSADPIEHGRAVAAEAIRQARTLTVTGLPDEAAMNKKLQDELEEAISGRKPVKQALDEAVAFWNGKLGAK
ncbi:ABC transporter substrate-binding protein [Silvimonas amylolytica]|uniref:Sugar ABC transporter substrate-binding protein n=1 Tax=Silvimonas amylolytica TaxID=449663 RepID=A0ABQ2PNR2_9NEIS|nr:sugar ABC transporter substrate-binding protein [Silvimonas amylolytica]GGP27010.1 sugar ABC transporter substrate-binding protein [Silvimonas amylolytica]